MKNNIYNLLSYIHQLPQNIIGLVKSLSKHCRYVHKINGRNVYVTDEFDGSMCLGDYIFISYEPDGILLTHEYGHSIQSIMLGWLYIPVIFIPSYVRCRWLFSGDSLEDYYDFYTESWANNLIFGRRK